MFERGVGFAVFSVPACVLVFLTLLLVFFREGGCFEAIALENIVQAFGFFFHPHGNKFIKIDFTVVIAIDFYNHFFYFLFSYIQTCAKNTYQEWPDYFKRKCNSF